MLKLVLQLMENDHIGAAVSHVDMPGSARPSNRWVERRNVRSGLLRKILKQKSKIVVKLKQKQYKRTRCNRRRTLNGLLGVPQGLMRDLVEVLPAPPTGPQPCALLQHQLNQGPAAALNLIRCRPART